MDFHFLRPEWLWLLVPSAGLVLLLWYQRDRAGSWQSVIAPHLLEYLVDETPRRRALNTLPLIALGWLLAVFAASGPSWEKLPQPVHQKQDALVILLDLSYSMKSADLAPSRKDRARQKLIDLLDKRREGQTGLIAFAGDAHIVTPLTDDTGTIVNLLPALNPDMMPVPGSHPAAAVSQGLDLLRSAGIGGGRLLLVTDELAGDDVQAIARLVNRSGAELSILGIGTPTGAPIPLPRGGFLKDAQGNIVMPGLDETPLQALATRTGGRYMRLQIDNSDIDTLLAAKTLMSEERSIALDRTADAWEDQGYLFLIPLVPLILGLFRRGWLLQITLPALFATLLLNPAPAQAQSWTDLWQTPDQQGQAALERDDPEAAAKLFEDPRWAGTAAYQHGDYAGAAEAFSEDPGADGWYNRGNALAREGKLDEAITAYEKSLELAPGQEDAEHNLALLQQLKEQQQQQQQQNQDQDQQSPESSQDDSSQNDDSGQDSESGDQSPGQSQPQQQNSEQAEAPDQGQEQSGSESAPEEPPETQAQRGESDEQAPGQEQAPPMNVPPINPEELERDQAMEQWLRRVPDDPSGLLREKFRYESQLRQQQGSTQDDDKVW